MQYCGRIKRIMLAAAKPPSSAQRREPKSRNPRSKGLRAAVGFLGRGQPAPLRQLGSLRSAVSSLSGLWGGAPAATGFLSF